MNSVLDFVRKHKGVTIGGIAVVAVVGIGLRLYTRTIPPLRPTQILKNQSTSIAQDSGSGISWSPYGEQGIEVVGQNMSSSYGDKNPLPTASIAKVMTALALLKKMPLSLGQQGPSMTMTADDVATYQDELAQNESVVQVSAGERLSEYQIIQAMLIPSATNIADSAAVWAFGSINGYLAYANQYARDLGMSHTIFAGDASGFSPDTVSTPQDLIKLGEVAMDNPVIAQIVDQTSVTLPVAGTLQNFDTDLGADNIIGIKTGNTDQAGGAFLFAAKYNSQLLVGAVMGAPNLGTALHDSPEILSSFESQLAFNNVVKHGQIVAAYKMPWGGNVYAVAQQTLSDIDWRGNVPAIQVLLRPISIGYKPGTSVGTVAITNNGRTEKTSVILQEGVNKPDLLWRISHK